MGEAIQALRMLDAAIGNSEIDFPMAARGFSVFMFLACFIYEASR